MFQLFQGDCLQRVREMPAASVDAVITDPPYPEINRPYGRLTEAEWLERLMKPLVREVRRVLKPQGSALLVLQPNSSQAGSMRPWVWDFLSWASREWNVVQDFYAINFCALPTCGATRRIGLMRPAVKMCVWLGRPDCYRNQNAILLTESEGNKLARARARHGTFIHPSGLSVNERTSRQAAADRGGVTPFNFTLMGNAQGSGGHPAATPIGLCERWVQYICPLGGVVLDPFCGSGTTGVACIRHLRRFTGIERDAGYLQEIAQPRLTMECVMKFHSVGHFAA
jgi:DNA modification methylase